MLAGFPESGRLSFLEGRNLEGGKIDGRMQRFAFHCLVREFLLCFHGFRTQYTVQFALDQDRNRI